MATEWKEYIRVFKNKVLRGIFGPKRDENGQWRSFHNEELHILYRSPNIVKVIKSRKLIMAGHVARMEEGRNAFKILTGKPTGLGVDGRTILEWILKKWVSLRGTGLIRLRIGIIGEPL